jgi:hypothetical protein
MVLRFVVCAAVLATACGFAPPLNLPQLALHKSWSTTTTSTLSATSDPVDPELAAITGKVRVFDA